VTVAPTIRQSVAEALADRVAKNPNLDWLLWKDRSGEIRRLTFLEARGQVENVARALTDLGIKVQDRVGIMSKNRPEWVLADLGAIHAGAISVPVYDTLAPAQVRHIVAHSEMRLLFVANPELLAPIIAMRAELPKLERVVLFEGEPPADPPIAVSTWADLLAIGEAHKARDPELFEKRWKETRRDDVLTIVYTSGTMGDPKGVLLTQGNILSQIETLPRVVEIRVGDLAVSYLPLAHIFERTAGEFLPIMNGSRIAFAESLEKLPANILEFKPDYLLAVPRVLEKVYDRVLDNVHNRGGFSQRIFWWAIRVGGQWEKVRYEKRVPAGIRFKKRLADRLVSRKVKEGLGGKIRFVVSGAAPLNPKIVEFFLALDLPVLEGYGLTESSPVIAVNPLAKVVPGTVGKMIPGIQVEIWERQLQGAPPDVEGEIVTKGPHVMKGYYKDEVSTKAAVDREGWLHTGDIGKRDTRGYITITDRKKNIIVNSYGKNIAPGPLEARISQSKFISSVMLFGDKHKYLAAIIAPNFEELTAWAKSKVLSSAESPRELVKHDAVQKLYRGWLDEVGKDFSKPEQVRRFTLLDHELTIANGLLTPSLKVKRAVVEKQYAAVIHAMYADEHEFAADHDPTLAQAPVPH
jgi:long-chain acyl-CoA synthetase